MKKLVNRRTRARALFKLRNTSYFLINLKSAMSPSSSRACSTALATYPTIPYWKSLIEALAIRGAPSSSRGGVHAGTSAWESPLMSTMAPSLEDLLGLGFLGEVAFSPFHDLLTPLIHFPFFISRIRSERLSRRRGRRLCLGCLVWHVAPYLRLQ